MPTAIAAPACRRPIVLIAAWLIVLQAFLAGVAAAQAAAMAAADPINAICHGAGGADANDGATPQSAKIEHLCCAHCTSAAPARKACSTMSHAAIRTMGRRHAVAANAVGT